VSRLPPRPLAAIDKVACADSALTGAWHLRSFLTDAQQDAFVAAARDLRVIAPMLHPTMRDKTPLSVRVSSFGRRGWWADAQGFRYIEKHPVGRPFPPIPDDIREATYHALHAASRYTSEVNPQHTAAEWGLPRGLYDHVNAIDTCLVNLYAPDAVLGWHVDQTELDRVSPIVTFSIGASCTFELKLEIRGETRVVRHTLRSGDAVIMAGPSRLAEHRVVNIHPEQQADLFGPPLYNPIQASAPGTRLSFTLRRTGYA